MIEQILQADRYLQVDQVAKARGMYARVVELDPRNAIAVVGLARCALAEGDEREAHRLAAQALDLDPENDMARRMEARLTEIFAARGERVTRPALETVTIPGPADPEAMRSPTAASAGPARAAAPGPLPPAASPGPRPPAASPGPRPPAPARAAPADPVRPPVPPARPSFLQRLLGR